MSISSALMFDVMAMMGRLGLISRMQTVAETPSRCGMMISIRIRSKFVAPWLILLTASSPSR